MFRNPKGYTLIELIVVIVLIGLLMSFTIPRFQESLFTDDLKGATRTMVELVSSLREDAVTEQRAYFLWLDLETDMYWISYSGMTEGDKLLAREESSYSLGNVEIIEVRFSEEKSIMSGEASIRFDKKGYAQPSEILLGDDEGRRFTLVIKPFLKRIEILESD